ncbi:MAG: SRPBCC family protein [Planctomycetota bacterium]|nr:SRPBCC family protein [Planctomycetota bacterium]
MHELRVEQMIPLPVERVFPFFENPENLEAITPPLLNFRIVTPRPIEMRKGALIDYRLKIRGVPTGWRTLISEYDPPHRFEDRQVRGPYRTWIHLHTFEAVEGGTLMRDIVRYELPRVPGSSIVHRLLVRPDLEKIFEYRRGAIERLLVGGGGTGKAARGAPVAGSAGLSRAR